MFPEVSRKVLPHPREIGSECHARNVTGAMRHPLILRYPLDSRSLNNQALFRVGEITAMKRVDTGREFQGGNLPSVFAMSARSSQTNSTSRPPSSVDKAPPGRRRKLTCQRKCLSMPPTPRKLALWWLKETRLTNLTLNPLTNASLLAIST